jgi:hypothetical protein
MLKNLQCKHYLAVHGAHRKLDTHVYIAPNHVSISDPKAMDGIYPHGTGFIKDGFYHGGAGEFSNMADASVKAEHQAKANMLAPFFGAENSC